MSVKRPRIPEIEIARAIAIIAVVLIHVTADPRVGIPWGSRSYPVYLALNNFSTFAVPVFIMLSGLVLFYRYAPEWNAREALKFYGKRLLYIVIPYLIWSFFYYVFFMWLSPGPVRIDWLEFLNKIRWADTAYHLYFIIIIVQFYAVFPLLMTLVKALRWGGTGLIVLGILVQGVFYFIHREIRPFEHYPSLMTSYFALFCIGGAAGINYEGFQKRASHLWWWLALTLCIGFANYLVLILAESHIFYPGPFLTLLFNLYSAGAGVAILWISKRIHTADIWAGRWMVGLGKASFGIYLMHPAILGFWKQKWPVAMTHSLYFFWMLGLFTGVMALSWGLTAVLRRWKWTWPLFGR